MIAPISLCLLITNVRRLTYLDDKQSSVLKKYLRDHGVQGSIPGQDPRDKANKPGSNWLTVLEGIYEAVKDKPELLNTAVLEFYKNYKIPTCTQHLIIKCLSQIVRDI